MYDLHERKRHFSSLLKLSLGGSGLENVRDGNAGVAVGEMRVVPAAADGDPEPESGHPAQLDLFDVPVHHVVMLERQEKKLPNQNYQLSIRHAWQRKAIIEILRPYCPSPKGQTCVKKLGE